MSMSSLGDQLAALSSSAGGASGPGAGTVRSSSRATNDGVGRGFHHSSRHGHSILQGGDVTRVPSILYENAREAAEVSLLTLREHAAEAWENLCAEVINSAAANSNDANADGAAELWNDEKFLGRSGLLSVQNLEKFERGTSAAQRNLQVDESIERMLGLLATVTAECSPPPITAAAGGGGDVESNPTLLAALHLVEYLLRKYHAHARPTTAGALLAAFLPLQISDPVAYPQIFARILSLVDLQSIPEWTFLRPYAARGAPPLRRNALAKHVAKSEALVKIIAGVGKRGAEVCLAEGSSERDTIRRGISTLVSFSASVLVEALHLQSSNKDAGVGGGMREGTARILFPLVVSACRGGGGGCYEWKEWGRILASTLSTLCPLSGEVRVALCDAVAGGLPVMTDDCTKLSGREAEDASSVVVTLISILGSMNTDKDDDDEEGWECYLPMLPPRKKRGKRKRQVVDYVGGELPRSTYRRLAAKGEALAVAMGAVIGTVGRSPSDDDEEDKVRGDAFVEGAISPLAASVLMRAFATLEGGLRGGGGDGGEGSDVRLILSIIREPSLASLWGSKRSALVAAVTVRTIVSYDGLHRSLHSATGTDQGNQSAFIFERYASILSALSEIDSAVHDQAVAYAINNVDSSGKSPKREKERRMARLARLLGREDVSSLISDKDARKDGGDGGDSREEGVDPAALLPARVALEHADASVRLAAVGQLKLDMESGRHSEVALMSDGDLGRTLLRRLGTDNDPDVAAAAGEIVAVMLKGLLGGGGTDEMEVEDDVVVLDNGILNSLAREALTALLRWTFLGKRDDAQSCPEIAVASGSTKKKRKKKINEKRTASPLLPCISVCGSVATLILDRIRGDGGDLDEDHPLTDSFSRLFLSLGAHVCRTDDADVGETFQLVEEVSDATSEELLQLGGGLSCTDVADFSKNSISQHVLTRIVSQQQTEGKRSARDVTSAASVEPLRSHFLRLALESYSNLIATETFCNEQASSLAGDRRVQMALDLILHRMKSYARSSNASGDKNPSEATFLREACSRYLGCPTVVHASDLFETAILKLASDPSEVSFAEISEPAIASLFDPGAAEKHGVAPGELFAMLLRACLWPSAGEEATSRILGIAASAIAKKPTVVVPRVAMRDFFLPTLALLSHSNRNVRERAIGLLEKCPDTDQMISNFCSSAKDKTSPLWSSLAMDGADTLPRLLGQVVSSSSSGVARRLLIEGCKSCALIEKENGDEFSTGGCEAAAVILSSMEKAGEASFPLSKRWEFAGNELFQAFVKFDHGNSEDSARKQLLPHLCRLRDVVLSMMKGVLVNEAQAGNGDGDPNIQISAGPSSTGRKRRSHSIDALDAFPTLVPYPETMLRSILEALSPPHGVSPLPLCLSKHVIQMVVSRPSWSNAVFPQLKPRSRYDLASALLVLRIRNDDGPAGRALLGLPLTSPDLLQLLDAVEDASLLSENDQATVAFVTDCVRGKLEALGSGGAADVSKLSSKLFNHLLALSSAKNSSCDGGGDSGGRDYTRVSILQTLLVVHSHYQTQLSTGKHDQPSKRKRGRPRSHSDVGSRTAVAAQAELLVGLTGGNASAILPLESGRGSALSMALLTRLCEQSPSAVLPALMNLVGASPSEEDKGSNEDGLDTKVLGDVLLAIIPHAHLAGLSLFNLLESFVGRIVVLDRSGGNKKLMCELIDRLVDALTSLPTKEGSSDAVASLAACVMALQAFGLQKPRTTTSSDDGSETRLEFRVLANTTNAIKIAVALSMLGYAEGLLSYICGILSFTTREKSVCGKTKVNLSDVVALALRGSNDGKGNNANASPFPAAYSSLPEVQRRSILYLAINLLQSVRDTLSTATARRIVRKSRGDDADTCLRLWNGLMQTHASALRAKSKLDHSLSSSEKRFWDAAPVATGECLDCLQNLLPVPHFLASASAILTNDEDEDAMTHINKRKILKILTDRVSEVSFDSAEAALFLDMVADLVAQVNLDPSKMVTDADGMRRTVVVRQGALIAIESFARSLCPPAKSGKSAASAASAFLPALAGVAKLLDDTASSWTQANGNDGDNGTALRGMDAQCQLLSSSSLCIASLVTTLKARCLPQLPKIIQPLMKSLKSVNNLLLEDPNVSTTSSMTGELLQLSILKTLQAIAETVPQFLLPYLPLIFSDNGLPSKALRGRHEHKGGSSVRAAVVRVETALATKVQVRQLIPVLSRSLAEKLQSKDGENREEEARSVLNVMTIAVDDSKRSELSPIVGKIFNGLVLAYGHDGGTVSTPQMLQSTNKCLLALVMKLSESQLRMLYARLREWRGEISMQGTSSSSARRYAFWSFSAELSKSLRSIFLPCLTSVLADLIDELELAVSLVCQRTTKKADGSKRRRVDVTDGSEEEMEKVKPLQPLLLCLELALKADAHEGGNWTRGDDNQRYKMILNHLGKLLLAQVSKGVPLLSDLTAKEQASTSAYQQLIQGVGTLEHGNVVGCLTALAAAAGNEQLWKPLNFAVLEACGHGRQEVRRAGIRCLLSVIETIGEEYMVLLPECLPVISELLEDDEEIAAMARECVRQGEELLGESLEDSLR